MIRYEVIALEEGKATAVVHLISRALDDIPELTWQLKRTEALVHIVNDIEANARFEVVARNECGSIVGAAIMAADDDCQVGELISVQWFYVAPEYRGAVGRKLVRLTRAIASASDFKVMAFTHRISEGRYEINYRKLEAKDGEESKESS